MSRNSNDLETWIALNLFLHCGVETDKPSILQLCKKCLRYDPLKIEKKIRKKALKILLLKYEPEIALVSSTKFEFLENFKTNHQ